MEAQGEKIRDLDLCLDEHREKLNTTEEMLQQVGVFFLCKSSLIACCLLEKKKYYFTFFLIFTFQELLCRAALETQKLELMSELTNLKLKLNNFDKERVDFDDRFRDSEV